MQTVEQAVQAGYNEGYNQKFQENWYSGAGNILSILLNHGWQIVYRKLRDRGFDIFEAAKLLSLSSEQITKGEEGYQQKSSYLLDDDMQAVATSLQPTTIPKINIETPLQIAYETGFDVGTVNGRKQGWYQGAEKMREYLVQHLWLIFYEKLRRKGLSVESIKTIFALNEEESTFGEAIFHYTTAIHSSVEEWIIQFLPMQ